MIAKCLLKQGVNPSGGAGTGLDALDWLTNRGQLEAVRLLISAKARLKTRSMWMAATLSERRFGRPSTNRDAIIRRSLKSCSKRAPTWKTRITPPGTSPLTPSCSATGRGNPHRQLPRLRLAPRAARTRATDHVGRTVQSMMPEARASRPAARRGWPGAPRARRVYESCTELQLRIVEQRGQR